MSARRDAGRDAGDRRGDPGNRRGDGAAGGGRGRSPCLRLLDISWRDLVEEEPRVGRTTGRGASGRSGCSATTGSRWPRNGFPRSSRRCAGRCAGARRAGRRATGPRPRLQGRRTARAAGCGTRRTARVRRETAAGRFGAEMTAPHPRLRQEEKALCRPCSWSVSAGWPALRDGGPPAGDPGAGRRDAGRDRRFDHLLDGVTPCRGWTEEDWAEAAMAAVREHRPDGVLAFAEARVVCRGPRTGATWGCRGRHCARRCCRATRPCSVPPTPPRAWSSPSTYSAATWPTTASGPLHVSRGRQGPCTLRQRRRRGGRGAPLSTRWCSAAPTRASC